MQSIVRPIILAALLCTTLCSCANSTNDNSASANSNVANVNSSAVRTTPTPSTAAALEQVLANPSSSTDDRVKAIDAYVADLEAKLPGLTRREKVLKPEDLKGVTAADLEKLHAYYDGASLKRVKTYPKGGSRKTEEFYFHDDKLVFVFVEPEGEGKKGDDRGAKGDRLYFGDNGLVAWHGEDGKPKDPTGTEFKTKGSKMVAEAAAFRELVK